MKFNHRYEARDYDEELFQSTKIRSDKEAVWVWLAIPILLVGLLVFGWVRSLIGV